MSARVAVPVLCDANGTNYGPAGKQFTISTESIVRGIVQKRSRNLTPPEAAPLVDTLEVFDPEIGTLYLLMTVSEYQQAASEAQQGASLPELPSANIFVGDVDNEATPVPVSGDLTMDPTGSFTIQKYKVVSVDVIGNGSSLLYNFLVAAGYTKLVSAVINTYDGVNFPRLYYANLTTTTTLQIGVLTGAGLPLPNGLTLKVNVILSR